nr:TaqI-like C-terminal specificity domain-containing protein [Helicobacter sp. UBA3407]
MYQLFAAFLDSQHSTQFEAKIIWAEMTQSPCFIYEDKGYYINQTCYFIPRDDKYLCAILNSKLIYFYMQQIASNLGDGVFRWIKQYIEKLPIPQTTKANQHIVNQIIALVDEILKFKVKDSTFDISALESQIDKLVYKLYCLNDEEIQTIQGSVR